MRNITNAFRRELYNDNRAYVCTVTIQLTDNTELTVDESQIWQNGLVINDNVSNESSFSALGSVIVNSGTLILNNIYDDFSSYTFDKAKVVISVGLEIDGVLESVKLGTFTVDNTNYNGALITLYCLDNMHKFDKPYSGSSLVYPATLQAIVTDACTNCGVLLQTTTFPNYNITIADRPIDEAITYREVISYAAVLAGCFARCNADGKLELKWFDITSLESAYEDMEDNEFDPEVIYADGNPVTVHYLTSLSSQDVSTDDIIITGVRIITSATTIESTDTSHLYGNEGYVISIEKNPFITESNVAAIGAYLQNLLVGLSFRKATISHLNDPSIEAGDTALVFDRKGNIYPILVTNTTFNISQYQRTISAAETPVKNSAVQYTEITKTEVESKKLVQQEKTLREQMGDDLTDAINAKAGMYETRVQEQGGGYTYYMHDKPLLADSTAVIKVTNEAVAVTPDYQAQTPTWYGLTVDGNFIANIMSVIGIDFDWGTGGTLVLGGQNNVNGSLTIKDASNNVIGTWTNTGINAQEGKIGGWEIDNYALLYSRTVEITGGTLQEYTNLDYYSVTGFTAKHTSSYEQSGYNLFSSGVAELYTIDAHYDYAPRLDVYQQFGTRKRGTEVNAGGVRFYDIGGTSEYNFTLTKDVKNTVTNITRSGTTFTATRLDGTTFTFTQQDNNSVTGVKGNAESAYRTGNINLTPANIGALALTGGTLTGTITLAGSNINLGTNSTATNNSGDIVWLYGNGTEKMRIWTDDVYTAKKGPNYKVYDASGTELYSGQLVITDGTGASGKWGINITGHADGDLALTGGTISGVLTINGGPQSLMVQASDTSERYIRVKNSVGNILLDVDTNGNHGLYSSTKSSWLLYANSSANSTNSTLYIPRPVSITGSLSLSGGLLSGGATSWNQSIQHNYIGGDGTIQLFNATQPRIGFNYNNSTANAITLYHDGSKMVCSGAFTAVGTLTGYDYSGSSHVMVGSAADSSHRVAYLYHQNATTVRVYGQAGGGSYTTYTTLTGSSSSDIRLKRNVADTEIVNALSVINQIEMRSFDWLPGWRDYTHQPIGMIADQIEKLDSRLVIGGGYDPDGEPNYKVIDDHYLSCYLTKGVQELCDKIEMLENENKKLMTLVNKLLERI